MERRTVLKGCGFVIASGLAGCTTDEETPEEVEPVLTIFADISNEPSGWELTARVRNDYDWDVSIHDISLIAYDEHGETVCRTHVGDLIKNTSPDRTVTMSCDQFPAIITATAEETPCEGAKIMILRWRGTDQERTHPNDADLWEQGYRQCGGGLPPDRYVDTSTPE